MTIATVGAASQASSEWQGGEEGNLPHAAAVFYAVDESLRLIFLSRPDSTHGAHISRNPKVAVTVCEDYENWQDIQGLQLWGEASLLKGSSRARALMVYLGRFPFVRDLMKRPGSIERLRNIGVYGIEPSAAAFTDNTTGVFGREVVRLMVE